MKKFVMNCDDYYYDRQNEKSYFIPKGTEVILVDKTDKEILGTIDSGEGKGHTVWFTQEELDEIE